MREYHKQVLLGLKFLLSRGLPLVLVSAAAAGVFLLKTPNSAKQASAPGARDPNATVGQYEGKSEAEIQAELDKVVQEGMFNISINPDIRMTSGRAEAELRVENIPANHHLMSVTLSRDDTGEVLYASGLIEPGYHIQAVPLETVLPGGSNVRMTHDQMARYMGSAREVVSRLLKYFAQEGWVRLYRGGVEVLDKQKLQEIARGQ